MSKGKICIVGLGYIGLPTAAIVAAEGYDVHGVDKSERVVDTINAGNIHIVEPDLDGFVRQAVEAGRLKAALVPAEADIFMICVPTPFHADTEIPTPDISYVQSAAKAIAPFVRPGNIVILESTSPVGTTEAVRGVLADEGVAVSEIFFAYCPERVLPGRIMTELRENDRIVGGLSPEAAEKVAGFYRTFVTGAVLVSDARTAEMAKLTENSFRDVNIAFANELSLLCEGLGIDVWELISLANRHPRVNILQPGCGVGGHCIAVDPWFIVSQDPTNARMIRTAREVNLHKTEWVIDQVRRAAVEATEKLGRAPVVACLGLAFKPNIDDLRESPALEITEHLLQGDENSASLNVVAVEPNIHEHAKLPLRTLEAGLQESDIVVILVNHLAFKGMNLEGKIVLDFCGFGR